MKNAFLGLLLVLCVVAISWTAQAGDDYTGVSLYADAGVGTCSSRLFARAKYAVQCDGAANVRLSAVGAVDGGAGADWATTNDVKTAADVLYDTPTTSGQTYICVRGISGYVTCRIYLNRGTRD